MMDVTLNAAQLLMNGGVDSDTFNPILERLQTLVVVSLTLVLSDAPAAAAEVYNLTCGTD